MSEQDEKVDEKDALSVARKRFKESQDQWTEVRNKARDDMKFALLGEQWPEDQLQERQSLQRPALTLNRMPSFIRQVVNDARQNRPAITVRPAEGGDYKTADMMGGLFRNIEAISNADIAYDTAVTTAVSGSFGFVRIDVDYTRDDAFDMDILIKPVVNPFSVLWDAMDRQADSRDWRYAFIVEDWPKSRFRDEYPNAECADVDTDLVEQGWFSENTVRVAEYFERIPSKRKILLLSDGNIVDAEEYEKVAELLQSANVGVVNEREVQSFRVIHRLMSGAEFLTETPWAGSRIPISPCWGDDINIAGERHILSLIHHAKDSQRLFNLWRSNEAELISLAPKTPFIGPEAAFTGTDKDKWALANKKPYAYISYKGNQPPQRQQYVGAPVAEMRAALAAQDDMKSIIGIYDASLGARSNETSGRAILARQREGDVSTFHFIDNLSRCIRGVGEIILDLIPKVYTPGRVVRILGEDGKAKNVAGGAHDKARQDLMEVYDISNGRYDLVVSTGPSFTTRREEAATQIMEMGRVVPDFFKVAGDILARNFDWPGAEELAKRLEKMVPPELKELPEGAPPPPPKPDPAMMELAMLEKKAAAELELERKKAEAQYNLKRQELEGKLALEAQADKTKAENEYRIALQKMNQEHAIRMQEIQKEHELRVKEKAMELDVELVKFRTKPPPMVQNAPV